MLSHLDQSGRSDFFFLSLLKKLWLTGFSSASLELVESP